ncbi:MAG: OmpH family outer membrane protein [Planctomycetota bacterium]|nr:MAG: OmpH family outer membrane protein [Planctomycetota bacterium]REJ94644.1 MAG: OmpH family outer membrane protein [Planctomycetota bacterium]
MTAKNWSLRARGLSAQYRLKFPVPVMEDPSLFGKGVLKVKFPRTISPRLVPLVLLTATAAGALGVAQPAVAQVRGGVFGVNMKYIVEQHNRYNTNLEALKAEFKPKSEQLAAERSRIQQALDTLRNGDLDPNSEPFGQQEEKLAREMADWNIRMKTHQRDIQKRNAKLLQSVYTEIKSTVEQYSTRHGIAVVVQFAPPPMSTDLDGRITSNLLIHPVVHVNPQYDITRPILEMLNRGQQPVVPGPNRNADGGVPPRPPRR